MCLYDLFVMYIMSCQSMSINNIVIMLNIVGLM